MFTGYGTSQTPTITEIALRPRDHPGNPEHQSLGWRVLTIPEGPVRRSERRAAQLPSGYCGCGAQLPCYLPGPLETSTPRLLMKGKVADGGFRHIRSIQYPIHMCTCVIGIWMEERHWSLGFWNWDKTLESIYLTRRHTQQMAFIEWKVYEDRIRIDLQLSAEKPFESDSSFQIHILHSQL